MLLVYEKEATEPCIVACNVNFCRDGLVTLLTSGHPFLDGCLHGEPSGSIGRWPNGMMDRTQVYFMGAR